MKLLKGTEQSTNPTIRDSMEKQGFPSDASKKKEKHRATRESPVHCIHNKVFMRTVRNVGNINVTPASSSMFGNYA